jgi:hypothetical protein
MKLLLENPNNVHDLFTLTGSDVVDLIDFYRLRRESGTFVQRDYRRVESDVVLQAPLRVRRTRRAVQTILIYILIEHQTEPDRLMPLRVLEYVVQIFKKQTRDWAQSHTTFTNIRLHPVLPGVFYTGTRRRDSIGTLVDPIELGRRLAPVTPHLEPRFINLPAMPAEQLKSEGRFFGWLLRLIQERQTRAAEFRSLLNRILRHLETMPATERLRWLELLSYIDALIYHERDVFEQPELHADVDASVGTDEFRQGILDMCRTMAQVHKEEGVREGEVRSRRQILFRHLGHRFGSVPPATAAVIEATDDLERLDAWLDRVLTARSLKQIGITPPD